MTTTTQRRKVTPTASCIEPDRSTPVAEAPDDDTLALMAKALAHPARVRIIRVLDERTTCVTGDVVLELGLAQSTGRQGGHGSRVATRTLLCRAADPGCGQCAACNSSP